MPVAGPARRATKVRLSIAGGYPPEDQLDARDWGAADGPGSTASRPAGARQTLPSSSWLFLPLRTAQGPLGVLGVSFEGGKRSTRRSRRLLDALVDQVAVAIERAQLTADIEESRVYSETESLRAALLSSVSHDLRTPLVSIIGAATSLIDSGDAIGADRPPAARRDDPRRGRAAQPLRPEPARHDADQLRRAAARPRSGSSRGSWSAAPCAS